MDTQTQIDQLNKKIADLERVIQSLRADATIPFDIREAFKASIGGTITAQPVSASIYATSVNEAGTNTYSVARVMDKTVPVIIDGIVYSIGLYN